VSRLSVVIPNWNGQDLLPGCLDPLEGAGFEVIVVDNGSVDGSLDLLRSRYPWVRVIANPDNRGTAVANNQGMAESGGEYILLLNSDTMPDPAAFHEAIAFLDAHPEVGIMGPTIVFPDGSAQASCGPGPNLWTELMAKTLLHRVVPGVRERAPKRQCRADWVTAAAMFVRREAVDAVSGIDENMFMFYEDNDFCTRVRQAGYEIWFVPTTPIVHIGGASRKHVEAQSLIHSYQSAERFFSKHGPAWRRRVWRGATVAEMALRSALWAVLGLQPERRPLARERLRAYRRILRLALTPPKRGQPRLGT
jgi:GT2 family glycosyltransferase